MQVFEFHFNPKLREDLIFDSFCYEPENIYEKRVGSLYLLGVLKNVLPQNVHFLERLTKVIQKEYYSSTLQKPEKSLKNSLKEANEFLENLAKRGDVSWLGNLNFGVISIKNFELNFTKVGDLKLFLLRKGQTIDIDQRLRFQDFEPYPLKIFGNIVSGKLAENDIILALTKEVSDFFQGQNLTQEIAQSDEKKLREIFKNKNDLLSKISGICLLIFLSKEVVAGRHPPTTRRETISPQLYPKEFSLKQIFIPIINLFKELVKKPRLQLFKFSKLPKFPKLPKIAKPKVVIPKITLPRLPQISPKLRKNLILVLALIFFLALGWAIAQREEKQQLKVYRATLEKIEEKVNQAETFLILKETKPQAKKEASLLFKESWEEISPLSEIVPRLPSDFGNRILSLKETISKNLYQINKLIEISEPEILFEFNPKDFIPQKMVVFKDELYFFSPYSQNLFKKNLEGEGDIIQIDQKFNIATLLDDSILFFTKPNQLTILKEDRFYQSLLEVLPDFIYEELSSFKSNLYFLDKKSGEIIKHLFLENFEWGSPQAWLASQSKKAIDSKSMAIDGSVWILNKNNSITRYYGGWPQEIITLDVFPSSKNFSKIFTLATLPHLYLLEPEQNRIVILNKKGGIVKQFQSEKFNNLLDFSVSQDAKTIYLLNGLKVFKVLP